MPRRMILPGLRHAGAIALLGLAATLARAEEKLVWRIGAFDRASNEFKAAPADYNDPNLDAVYRVGKSKDAEDWLRFQPGPANAMAGGREHPYTILFDLPEAPRGVYHLNLAVLYETPRLSYLKVTINGRAGNFYFHPKLDYGAGDWEGTFVPQTSVDRKTIDLPAAWLRRGENKLILTALDAPADKETSFGAIALGHTGLVYDALELTQDPAAKYDANTIRAEVEPTIFFRQFTGRLREGVDAYLTLPGPAAKVRARLRMGQFEATRGMDAPEAFGEQRVEFEVPEWIGAAEATLQVSAGGHSRSFPLQLTAAKKWTLLVVPHEHLDVGFTDYPEKIAELHAASADGAMELIAKHPDFRWTLDGAWVAQKYLAGRSEPKKQEFLEQIRKGNVILPAQFANQHTGTASLEGLIRSLYDSHELARQYHLPVGAANITDVPSYTWSYASVLHDAGVKYFAAASNSWRAPIQLLGSWNEKSPFYWQGPDGGKVLMWYSRAYLQMGTLFGTPPRIASALDSLPVFLQAYTRPDYQSDAAIIFGSQLENTALSPEQASFAGEWNQQYAWPRLEYSTFADAMARLEKQSGDTIPTFRGDFGPYWEDGFGSDAWATAFHRNNQQRILTAEKMAAIPALTPDLRPDRSQLGEAWHNLLLFDEHTWNYVGATTQPEHIQTETQLELRRARAREAGREITESVQRSWGQLESFLSPKETSLIVFNSLSWPRGGLVTADVPDGFGVFDGETGQHIEAEVVREGYSHPLPGFGGGYRRIRFLVPEVPAMGYRTFPLRFANDATKESPADATTFESRYYRITLDAASGGLRSVYDKELGRELVEPGSPFRFGAYVYVSGADDMPNNSLYRYGVTLKPPALTPVAASGGRVVSVKQTPFATIITIEASAPNTPKIRSEITLFSGSKRIDFRYDLTKTKVYTKEAAYIAFPFAVAQPAFSYETQNGWVNPAKDELEGGSREWYAVQHWAAVSGDGMMAAIAPVDAPLVNFGDIVRGNWPTEFTPQSGAIFSWLMNNYWGTNFVPGQGGEMTFRYSLTSGREMDAPALTRFGWDAMTPLEVDQVAAGFGPSALPTGQASLLTLDSPDTAVVTWKTAEDGNGTIIRLEEIAGRAATVRLSTPHLKISEAWRCNALEDNQRKLAAEPSGLALAMQPFEVVTLRLVGVADFAAARP